ncbi:hypothetical protein TNCV_921791 [Trichonephila clavipes]|nr:hypothetical protein TNCV_921791 [Trichonephila clavipes]
MSKCSATRGLWATALVYLNHSQMTRAIPELASPSKLPHHTNARGYGSLVVKVSDCGCHVTSLSLVPLKTRRVGEVMHAKFVESSNVLLLVRGGGCQIRCHPCHLSMVQKLFSVVVANATCLMQSDRGA